MKSTKGSYDVINSGKIMVYNAGDIESEFSKSSTKTDNIYIANSFNIGKLHMIKLDENNIIEYIS